MKRRWNVRWTALLSVGLSSALLFPSGAVADDGSPRSETSRTRRQPLDGQAAAELDEQLRDSRGPAARRLTDEPDSAPPFVSVQQLQIRPHVLPPDHPARLKEERLLTLQREANAALRENPEDLEKAVAAIRALLSSYEAAEAAASSTADKAGIEGAK